MRKNTKRYIVSSLNNLELSPPIRYERYYINDSLRVQKKDKDYQKEILDDNNDIIEKADISEKEFLSLKEQARSKIIRDSYLYLKDDRVSNEYSPQQATGYLPKAMLFLLLKFQI